MRSEKGCCRLPGPSELVPPIFIEVRPTLRCCGNQAKRWREYFAKCQKFAEFDRIDEGLWAHFGDARRHLAVKRLPSKDDVANELSDLARVIDVGWKDAYSPPTRRLDVSALRQLSNGLRDEQLLPTKWGYREHAIVDAPANDGTDPDGEP
jgi:hypothetical protein